MNIGKYVERGYEFVYEAKIITSCGEFTETRSLFVPADTFDDAKNIGEQIVSEAEMDEGCTSAMPISLAPKTRPKEKES